MNIQLAQDNLYGRDFYIQWAAGRSLAFETISPYQSRVEPFEAAGVTARLDRRDLKFNTPIYSLFLVFPFLLIANYAIAYSLWLVLSGLAVLWIVSRAFALGGQPPGRLLWLTMLAVLWVGYYSVQAFITGNLIILTSLFLILAYSSLHTGKYELAGFLFALTTIQAHVLWPVYLFLIFSMVSLKRWNVLAWFLAGIAILTVLGMFVVPEWPLEYARILWRFEDHFFLRPFGVELVALIPGFGRQLSWIITGLLAINLAVEWFLARGKDARWLYWTACLTLVAIQWVGIAVHPSQFFILSLPLLLVISVWFQRAGQAGQRMINLVLIAYLFFTWFFAYRSGLPENLIQPGAAHFFFLPVILWIGLYWTRWWAIKPQRLFIEELRGNEIQT